jgi:S1-C subfamily serine protease
MVSENIAYGYAPRGGRADGLAGTFVRMWKESEGHRRNLLDANATELGVGVARSEKTGRCYAVQMFGFAAPVAGAPAARPPAVAEPPAGSIGVHLTNDARSGRTVVEAVVAGSPAAKAGLRPGDLILKVGDETVGGHEETARAIVRRRPGDRVTLAIQRDGQGQAIEVTIGKRADIFPR